MGAISGLLGLSGGVGGTGIASPTRADILNPATVDQANTQYTNAQDAIAKQAAFLQAVQAQNGLGNQSNVFNQLNNIATGKGPNPAQTMLNQATGANVANTAALMAGSRGANANAGLIARQAAQQGAGIQQQAAGQAATMQANQSLGALNAMGNIANTQAAQQAAATGAYTGATQGEQGQILNSIAQQNNANVGMTSNVNNANASLAGTMLGGQMNMIGNVMGGIGSAMGLPAAKAKGGMIEKPKKMATGGVADSVYQPIPEGEDVFAQKQAAPMPVAAPVAAPATPPQPVAPAQPAANGYAGKSRVGAFLQGYNAGNGDPSKLGGAGIAGRTIGEALGTGLKYLFGHSTTPENPSDKGSMGIGTPVSEGKNADGTMGYKAGSGAQVIPTGAGTGLVAPKDAANQTQMFTTGQMAGGNDQVNVPMAAKGGMVDALLSPGERYLSPKDAKAVAKGKKDPMKAGKKVPGKPVVGGAKNSYANDIVPAKLEEGGIVLPRSVTMAKKPDEAAAKFVRDVMAKKGHMPKKA